MRSLTTYYRVERQYLAVCIIASTIYTLCLLNLVVAIMLKAGFFAQYKLVDTVTVGGLEVTSHLFVAATVTYLVVLSLERVRTSLALLIESFIAGASLLGAYWLYDSVFMHLA